MGTVLAPDWLAPPPPHHINIIEVSGDTNKQTRANRAPPRHSCLLDIHPVKAKWHSELRGVRGVCPSSVFELFLEQISRSVSLLLLLRGFVEACVGVCLYCFY